MIRRAFLIGVAVAVLPALAHAQSGHSHAGANGGEIAKIGKYEVELVVGAQEVRIFLTDEKDNKIDSAPFSASAVVLARGNERRTIDFSSAGGNVLAAKYSFEVDGKFRATVTLHSNGQDVGRGRFTTDVRR